MREFIQPKRSAANAAKPRELSLADLRQHIGIVPQDAVIFSANAMANIRYGKPGASDDAMNAAARAEFAYEFIGRLTEGYGTFLGERGVPRSGEAKGKA